MKKTLVAVVAALMASTASAAISGSSHDMALYLGAANVSGSRCAFCHMPHQGTTIAGAPLWARNVNYAVTYTFFSSTSGGKAQPTTVGNGSRACLSCHDGNFALATVFTPAGGTQSLAIGAAQATKLTGVAQVGPNLSNDHPISVTYDSGGNNIGGLVATAPTAFGIAQGSVLECTNCHNAHGARGSATAYPNRSAMVSYAGDFCVACHGSK
jgi:hypothetical protein